MQLNLRSTLRIGLSPAALEMAAFDWRGRCTRTEHLSADGASGGWKAQVVGLKAQLKDGQWRARTVEIVLSGYFVRHCLLPAELHKSSPTEQATYMRHIFRAEYGDAVDGWRVATDVGSNGLRLACAIDAALYEELATVCREAGAGLRSVRPYLIAMVNHGRVMIREATAWLVVVESNLCLVALIEAGRWRHIGSKRLVTASGEAILRMVREQETLLGSENAVRKLYLGGVPRTMAGEVDVGGWDVQFLPTGGVQRPSLISSLSRP